MVISTEQDDLNFKSSTSKSASNERIRIISVDIVVPDKITNKILYERKEQFCLFCQKLVKRFARHLTAVHKEAKEVQDIIALEKYTAQKTN